MAKASPGFVKHPGASVAQFYSRIGFVHEFRPLGASEVRQLLQRHWAPTAEKLPEKPLDPETVAAIIRITGGNFRLLNRLLTQIERILEINALAEVTKAVLEAARASLVIGAGPRLAQTTVCATDGYGNEAGYHFADAYAVYRELKRLPCQDCRDVDRLRLFGFA
jgi:hypothetical protein